jgi:O-antigen/teichoic acid export membrane protein
MVVARNVIANIAGTSVMVVATAATTILSFRIAGAEQYGLIGLYLTLHSIIAMLDTGLGPGLVREIAHARTGDQSHGLKTILFTFQLIYIAIIALTTLVLVCASSFIATTWLTVQTILPGEIQVVLVLAALTIGLQRLRTVYSVFLEGLEQQVLANLLQSSMAVLRAIIVLGAMIFISPTAIVFLSAMLFIGVTEVFVTAVYAWRSAAAPGGDGERFSLPMIRRLWRYLVTCSIAVATGTLLQCADKFVVSTALPLDVVGRYIFISQICLIILKLAAPNVTAFFPRLSASVRREDWVETRRIYFAASQTVSCIVAILVLGAAFFGSEALYILTGSWSIGRDYYLLLAVLAAAYGLNSLCLVLYALQRSKGDATTALWGNAGAAVLYLPALIFLTPIYGIMAPALLWLALNAVLFAVSASRQILPAQAWSWLLACVIPQFATVTAILAIARVALPHAASVAIILSVVLPSTALAVAASVAASSELRLFALDVIRRWVSLPGSVLSTRLN